MGIPQKLKARVKSGSFKSTLWLLSERMIKMGLGFVIFALIARHLGPQDFGLLNYSIAFVALVASFTPLGLSGLVVRELVKYPDKKDRLLGSTLFLRFLTGLIAFCGIFLFINTNEDSDMANIILLIVSFKLILDCFETFDLWFQSIVKSKYTAIAKIISLTAVSLVNLFLIYLDVGLLYFAIATTVEFGLIYILLFIIYTIKFGSPLKWKFDFTLSKQLLVQSWPLIFSGVAAVIYLKSDQIMLRWLDSETAVGIYSSAVRLSEVWFFLPTAIVTSLFPAIIKAKQENSSMYNDMLQKIYYLLFYLSVALALIVMLIGTPLINFAYGAQYAEGAIILKIHIWTAIFVFMRALLSKWLINENLLLFSLVSHGLGALSNIALNLLLIPLYGGIGAAIGTLLSFSVSTVLFTFFSKKTRVAGYMMVKTIFDPILRLVDFYKKGRKSS